jgi:hypothetical protein
MAGAVVVGGKDVAGAVLGGAAVLRASPSGAEESPEPPIVLAMAPPAMRRTTRTPAITSADFCRFQGRSGLPAGPGGGRGGGPGGWSRDLFGRSCCWFWRFPMNRSPLRRFSLRRRSCSFDWRDRRPALSTEMLAVGVFVAVRTGQKHSSSTSFKYAFPASVASSERPPAPALT